MDWLVDAVVYQINWRALAAREPRNVFEARTEAPLTESPFAYVTRHLPALKALGVTVLHSMPPFMMGRTQRKGIGSPYAIQDYYTIDPEWGTLAEFAAFVRAAHALDLRVIIGMVPNHTSRDHVWTESHPEFYLKDAAGDLAYDLDWTDTAKLDYTQPALRTAMREVYAHWLDFPSAAEGIDGFRIDMAHFINDRSFWDEVLPILYARNPERKYLFMAECYGTEHNKDLFQRGMNAAYDDDFYKCMQYFYARDAAGDTCIDADHNGAAHNADFAAVYAAFNEGGLAAAVRQVLSSYAHDPRPAVAGAYLARYTDNHDEGRGLYRFGPGGVQAMMQVAFLAPGTIPFLYGGQEFGAVNRPPIHERIQPCDKGYRCVGATETSTRQGVEFEGNLFARTHAERQAWYRFYQEWIALRRQWPALTRGSYAPLDLEEQAPQKDHQVLAFIREHDGVKLTCAVNLGPTTRSWGNQQAFQGTPIQGQLNADGALGPFAAYVVQNSPAAIKH